jgi:hypothetical protein
LKTSGFKKKLYRFRPKNERTVETQPTKKRKRIEPCDPISLERGIRQLLADKVSGNLMGLWLLIPEHLRLGTWDLLCGWTGQPGSRPEPRLALQLVHEAALCTTSLRQKRVLSQRGFELANGLPFVATDAGIHAMLTERTVAQTQRLQVALGRIRRASGDYTGNVLAIDPHRIRSYTKRYMRRHGKGQTTRPVKVAQTFFILDADTHQPLCFTTGTATRTATTAAIELLGLAADILSPVPGEALVVADVEHQTAELFDYVQVHSPFDLLVPMSNRSSLQKRLRAIPLDRFTRRWAGLSTAKLRHKMIHSKTGPTYQFVQRTGERPDDYRWMAFLSTADRDEAEALTRDYPKRWHVEEFFNTHQALGWNRAGTLNLNIRYGQMTAALVAQAALHRLRRRLGAPYSEWDAGHLAKSLLASLEGDVRVSGNRIVVTYYNAPKAEHLRRHYQELPGRLADEQIDPRIPWLYDYELDFRFR